MNKKLLSIAALVTAHHALTLAVSAKDNAGAKLFDGIYSGIEASLQNIYGGAFLDNIDVLQRDTRPVASLIAGWRKQLDQGFVFGIEGQAGLTDGNLKRAEFGRQVNISYNNSTQIGFGLHLGYAIDVQKSWLLYGYANITRRSFEIAVTAPAGSFIQEDIQGVLRYGLGIEKRWRNGWGIRASLGSSYTNFGDLITNINVGGKVDTAIGLTYQF